MARPPPTRKQDTPLRRALQVSRALRAQTTPKSLERMAARVCKLENPPKRFRLGVNTKAQGSTLRLRLRPQSRCCSIIEQHSTPKPRQDSLPLPHPPGRICQIQHTASPGFPGSPPHRTYKLQIPCASRGTSQAPPVGPPGTM